LSHSSSADGGGGEAGIEGGAGGTEGFALGTILAKSHLDWSRWKKGWLKYRVCDLNHKSKGEAR
jgi:hypothetical protein